MNDIRVAHIQPAPFAVTGMLGGAERYVWELARHMASQVPTTIVTFGPEDRSERHGDLRLRVLGHPWLVRGQASNPFSMKLFAALRSSTVIHCHQQHVLASSGAAAYGRLTGKKVFATDLGGGGWDISGYVSTDRWYHGHLHISRYSRSVYGHEGDRRAHVISGGVDTGKFMPDPAADASKTVLFVGRLLPHKGLEYLINAVPDGLSLELIGPAPDVPYAAKLRQLAARRRVTFSGEVSDEELVQAYQRALCVVLPSVYTSADGHTTRVPELLGQTLLEGMACGLPAICTDVASMPEVVEHGVTGFVVPPNNASAIGERLAWLRDHPREARSLGDAGRRRVLSQFTWEAVVRRCLEVYRA